MSLNPILKQLKNKYIYNNNFWIKWRNKLALEADLSCTATSHQGACPDNSSTNRRRDNEGKKQNFRATHLYTCEDTWILWTLQAECLYIYYTYSSLSTVIPAQGSNVPPLSASFSAITWCSWKREGNKKSLFCLALLCSAMNPPSITLHFPGLLGSTALDHRCCREKFKIDILRKKDIARKPLFSLSLSTYRRQYDSVQLPAAVNAAFTGIFSLFECAVCIFMSISSFEVDKMPRKQNDYVLFL